MNLNFLIFLSWHQILKIWCIHKASSVRKPKSSNVLPKRKNFVKLVRKEYGNSCFFFNSEIWFEIRILDNKKRICLHQKKSMWIGIPILFPHRFHKILSFGSILLDFGLPTEEALWIHQIFQIWCHDKQKRIWFGIPILLPHRLHKVLSLRKSVAWFWLPHRGSFMDTSKVKNLLSR